MEYDLRGNRNTVYDNYHGITRSYAHNEANEYTKVSTGLTPSHDYLYDNRGNLSRDDGFDNAAGTTFHYAYGPENRLTKVDYGPVGSLTTVATYQYDALGRRVEFINSPPGGTTATIRYYYDGSNMIAEYDQSNNLSRTYVHGPLYIDEHVLMRDHDGSGEDHYYLLQELYTVAGLAARNGQLEESYSYDTYGNATIWNWPTADVNRDGIVDRLQAGEDDYDEVSGELFNTCVPVADISMDGIVDISDLGAVKAQEDEVPVQQTYSSLDNPYLFTGRITDTLHADQLLARCPEGDEECTEGEDTDPDFKRLQDNRNRIYNFDRWLQRDPAGYVDGENLYEYVLSAPTGYVDWNGLSTPLPQERPNRHKKPFWRYVSGMGKLRISLGAAGVGAPEQAKSEMHLTFKNDSEAFRTRSCCGEIRFVQIHFTKTVMRNKLAAVGKLKILWGVEQDRWALDGDPYYPVGEGGIAGDPRVDPNAGRMSDTPGTYDAGFWLRNMTQDLETCAVCSKDRTGCNNRSGSAVGEVYGCVSWGHSFRYKRKTWKWRYIPWDRTIAYWRREVQAREYRVSRAG